MIRRGFWLAVGAFLGVTGYRRLARAARSVAPGRVLTPAVQRRAGDPANRGGHVLAGDQAAAVRAAVGFGREAGAFLRDVRIGMAEYMDRHSGRSGNTLVTQRAHASVTGPGSDNSKDGR
ncbi:MAG: hypothetical protein ACYCO9_08060 [Streptosporangiaceae bacterium]